MMNSDVSILEHHLGYVFNNREILELALRHSSFVNETPDKKVQDNERLEFLGDSVLNLIISHLLIDRFPALSEGDLSKSRSGLVNENQLSEIARKIQLGTFLRLGRGEVQSGGQDKNSILADALEALLAAVYLDGGFHRAFDVVRRHFSDLIDSLALFEEIQDDKSRVQEIVQATGQSSPLYRIIRETGPDHDKTFEAELTIGDAIFRGTGKSKKTAEQAAARKALQLIGRSE